VLPAYVVRTPARRTLDAAAEEVAVQVLWWLAPPLAATLVAMIWAAWTGRERSESRDHRDEQLRRMQRALAQPTPRRGRPVPAPPPERSHGVALRGAARRPDAVPPAHR
jgi:hypothetical protein